jgi:hypothetical protein
LLNLLEGNKSLVRSGLQFPMWTDHRLSGVFESLVLLLDRQRTENAVRVYLYTAYAVPEIKAVIVEITVVVVISIVVPAAATTLA